MAINRLDKPVKQDEKGRTGKTMSAERSFFLSFSGLDWCLFLSCCVVSSSLH